MTNCIFCQIASGLARSWIVWENEHALAFLDINPISRFHTLVVPRHHYSDLWNIPTSDLQEVIAGVQSVSQLLRDRLGINNVQVINNNGRAAQQEVFHLHFHIIPRSHGDGNNLRWHTHPEYRHDFDRMLGEWRSQDAQ